MSNQRLLRYLAALAGIALVTALLAPFQVFISSTIAALALLLVVLFAATFVGRNPAFLASVAGALCFNYFFLPPLYTLHIAEPINWIALGAFLITALVAGELSASAQKRAAEAEAKQRGKHGQAAGVDEEGGEEGQRGVDKRALLHPADTPPGA